MAYVVLLSEAAKTEMATNNPTFSLSQMNKAKLV